MTTNKGSISLSRRAVLQGVTLGLAGCGPTLLQKSTPSSTADARAVGSKIMRGKYRVEPVTFQSSGVALVGNLYVPTGASRACAAVPILGPYAYVKEQSPVQYATRLADDGFVALAFDCRNHGASGGSPRRYESPTQKIADVRAAIDFLERRPEVDAKRIGVLGVCEGASEMLHVAASDARVRGIAAVSGHYRDHDNDVDLAGGEELMEGRLARSAAEERLVARRERGRAAKEKFDRTGEVDYAPIVDPVRKDVALPWKMIWDWYHGWADRGLWENRYAVMGDPAYLDFESLSAARALKRPFLMIHADNSDGPKAARRHFESVPGADKELVWQGKNNHFQYYEDPVVIDTAVATMTRWFRDRLDA